MIVLKQSFNEDMMIVPKHKIIRPTGKDINILICLSKKMFHFFIVQKLGEVKSFGTKFNCKKHKLICSQPMQKLKQRYLRKKDIWQYILKLKKEKSI